MEINQLILLIKKKISNDVVLQNINIEDKTYLHKKHLSHEHGKYHLKINIKSNELKNYSRIDATKKIYTILNDEIKNYIHSIQISIN